MLDIFLYVALYQAVGASDVRCQPAHFPDEALAQQHCDRHDSEQNRSEFPVHAGENPECTAKLECSDQGGWNRQANHAADGCDILLDPVHHIPGMQEIPSRPSALHDMGENLVLQAVAQPYLVPCADLHAEIRQQKLEYHAAGHDTCQYGSGTFSCACGNVYQGLAGPDECQCGADSDAAGEGIEQYRPPPSSCRLPQPDYAVLHPHLQNILQILNIGLLNGLAIIQILALNLSIKHSGSISFPLRTILVATAMISSLKQDSVLYRFPSPISVTELPSIFITL